MTGKAALTGVDSGKKRQFQAPKSADSGSQHDAATGKIPHQLLSQQ